VGSVRDQILSIKIIKFLHQLSSTSIEERMEMVEKLNEDDKFKGRVGSAIIEILDRMESDKKPEFAAKCFSAFAQKEISYQELRRVLWALERVPSFDLEKLPHFANATIDESLKMDESLLIGFVHSGLGVNNGGFDGGAIVPTGICGLFLKIGIH
jgi:hypothetical protein